MGVEDMYVQHNWVRELILNIDMEKLIDSFHKRKDSSFSYYKFKIYTKHMPKEYLVKICIDTKEEELSLMEARLSQDSLRTINDAVSFYKVVIDKIFQDALKLHFNYKNPEGHFRAVCNKLDFNKVRRELEEDGYYRGYDVAGFGFRCIMNDIMVAFYVSGEEIIKFAIPNHKIKTIDAEQLAELCIKEWHKRYADSIIKSGGKG